MLKLINLFVMLKNICFVVFIVLAFSCKENTQYQFDKEDFSAISFKDVFSKIEVIPLETNSESMIYLSNQVIFHEDKFYVSDRYYPHIIVFDENGKFIRTIGAKGEGPGELIDIRAFTINKATGYLELCGNANSTVMVYDTTGVYIKEKSLPNSVGSVERIHAINDDLLILTSPWSPGDPVRVVSTKTKEIITTLPTYLEGAYYNAFNIVMPFVEFNDSILFTDIYNSSVYLYDVDKNKFELYKTFDFKDFNFDKKILPKPNEWINMPYESCLEVMDEVVKYVSSLDRYLETSKYWLYLKDMTNIILKNKITGEMTLFNGIKDDIQIITNRMNDDFIYGIMSAERILNFVNEDMIGSSAYSVVKNLSENDNPVIIKYYFK